MYVNYEIDEMALIGDRVTAEKHEKKGGFPAIAIILIVIGVVCIIAAGVIYFFIVKRRKSLSQKLN